jgi:ParB-like chromosome segregation protein Spo0J
MELAIHPELEQLCRALTPDEYAGLEASLLAEGCREALAVWGDEGRHILLDGHHRFKLCRQYDLAFDIVVIEAVHSLLDAKIWMLQNQMARRNLTRYERAEKVLQLEPLLEQQAAERMKAGKAPDPVTNSSQGRTRTQLAEAAGVSEDTIRKAKIISQEADEPTKVALRTGERTIHSVYVELRPPAPKDEATPLDTRLKAVRELCTLIDSVVEAGGVAAIAQRWSPQGQLSLLEELEALTRDLTAMMRELRAVCATIDVQPEEGR